MPTKPPKAHKPTPEPKGLGPAGRSLWKSVAAEYMLRPDELRVLEHCAHLEDRIRQLEDELAGQPVMVEGSRGQPVLNPLVAEIRFSRETFARTIAKLRLPDDYGMPRNPSVSARELARARWGGG